MIIKVNGLTINADGEQLLRDLRDALSVDGINLLGHIKPGVNNIQFSCPQHGGGQERHPSCGMSTIDTYTGAKIIPSGTIHCFTCGYTESIDRFISDCFNKADGGRFGHRWLKKNFVNLTEDSERDPVQFNFSRGHKREITQVYIEEQVLNTFRYIHPYMYQRGLTDEIIEEYDVGYDKSSKCLTFPVRDELGRCVLVQTRSVSTKFHHYAKEVNKTNYLYGLWELKNQLKCDMYSTADKCWVVESIINCLTLRKLGIPSIALMGTGGGIQYTLLDQLPFRHLVLALDPDEAGEKGKTRIMRNVKTKILSELVYTQSQIDQELDINDLQETVLQMDITLI